MSLLSPNSDTQGAITRKQRTVLVSLVTDFVLWLPDIAAAVLSGSIVLFADAVKCANEILATAIAYGTIKKMAKGGEGRYDYGMGKMETVTSIITGGAMFVSLALVFAMALYRIAFPVEIVRSGAYLGAGLMVVGVVTNSWLGMRSYRMNKRDPSPIMDSQWRLFRTKAFSDFSVLCSLIASLSLAGNHWALYIDPLTSFIIAGFLLMSGYRVITRSLPDLLDKTLDEELQLVIVRHLAEFFDDYSAIHGVRSRRSGSSVYIELLLEFEGTKPMSEVQASIDKIKSSLEANIPRSCVSVIPTSPSEVENREGEKC